MRWKFVLPFMSIVAIIILLTILFFDIVLRKAIESYGESALIAKVDVAGVSSRLGKLEFTLNGLQAADRSSPMRNLIEVGKIQLRIAPLPLLSKKIVIEEITVEELRWGTARAVSGALPKARERALLSRQEKTAAASASGALLAEIRGLKESLQQRAQLLGSLQDLQEKLGRLSPENIVASMNLRSEQAAKSMLGNAAERSRSYKQRAAEIDVQNTLAQAREALSRAQQTQVKGIEDIPQARKAIEGLSVAKQQLDDAFSKTAALKAQLEADFTAQKSSFTALQNAVASDVQSVLQNLQLPDIQFNDIPRIILGQAFLQHFENSMRLIHTMRNAMAARDKKTKRIVFMKKKGMDIAFPRENSLPDFLINRAVITGDSGGKGKTDTPVSFAGQAFDITSDPAILGRPAKLMLSGARGEKSLSLEGVLDHTTSRPYDSLQFAFSGLDAASFPLPLSEYVPRFQQGSVSLTGNFNLIAGSLGSAVEVVFRNLKTAAPADSTAESNKLADMISGLWSRVSNFSATAGLSGDPSHLEYSFSSSLDKELTRQFQGLYGAQLAAFREDVQREIDRRIAAPREKIQQETAQLQTAILGDIEGKEKEIQGLRKELLDEIDEKTEGLGGMSGIFGR